ncbi:hypothetical protein PR003_g31504 [Phytophthora rubi]|uniref:Peroxisomal membrane protein PEX16 n=1 Tax=Phytophthora rubi TaxID=129364 RepID=A0A6A4B994_9STRA|nr:hypothetical protein PR003_g31504 [Phytophthora rubi]
MLQKRVMEPEVATQFGYSLVGLLLLYHQYVLWKKVSADKDPPTGSHKQTRLDRVPLSLISHVQVLAEVVARRVGGDVGKWRLIVDVPDTLSHLLAFVLVLLGAHPLGLFFPKYFRLPLITGYLVAGILSGPFLANLLNEDVVGILGSYVNAFALSFISFQAGQEIYLPELRPQIKSIVALLATYYYCTAMALGTTVFMLAAGVSFYSGLVRSCQLGIELMFASISVLVSPSTVMGLKVELNSVVPFTHVALGTCMTAEFVVLVSFSVSRVVASIYCAKLAREHRLHHGRRAHEPRARSAARTRDDPHLPAAERPA